MCLEKKGREEKEDRQQIRGFVTMPSEASDIHGVDVNVNSATL